MTLDADLQKLTADELQLRLAAHAIERPLAADPGFVRWCEVKDAIKFHLDLKRGEERAGWKDTTTGQVVAPPERPTFGHSATPPKPIEEIPMTKPASELTPEQIEYKRNYHREWYAKNKAAKPAKKVAQKPAKAPKVVQEKPKPAPVKRPKVEGFPGIDALRAQALALLPMLDAVAFDEVEAARHELEAVGDILGLGFRMLSRKTVAA